MPLTKEEWYRIGQLMRNVAANAYQTGYDAGKRLERTEAQIDSERTRIVMRAHDALTEDFPEPTEETANGAA